MFQQIENIIKEIENIKRNSIGLKSIVTEMKNLLEDFLDLSRQKKLKVDQLKSIQSEKEREK